MSADFKTGDRVVCIDTYQSNGLTLGKIYQICHINTVTLLLVGVEHPKYAHRFVLASSFKVEENDIPSLISMQDI